MQTDEWPSFSSELGRKVSEILDKRVAQYEAGKITIREFFLIVNDLYDATSGLADRDVSEVLANVHQAIRFEAARKERESKV